MINKVIVSYTDKNGVNREVAVDTTDIKEGSNIEVDVYSEMSITTIKDDEEISLFQRIKSYPLDNKGNVIDHQLVDEILDYSDCYKYFYY